MRVHHRVDDREISGNANGADFDSLELIQILCSAAALCTSRSFESRAREDDGSEL